MKGVHNVPVIVIIIVIIVYIKKPPIVLCTTVLLVYHIILRCWPAQTARVVDLIVTVVIATIGMSRISWKLVGGTWRSWWSVNLPWRPVISAVLVRNSVRLWAVLSWLLILDLFKKNLIFPHFVFQLFELVFAFLQLALHRVRVAEQRVVFVNSLHLYQPIASALFLSDLLLNLLNLWHQLLFALGWRQITEVILWAVRGNCILFWELKWKISYNSERLKVSTTRKTSKMNFNSVYDEKLG